MRESRKPATATYGAGPQPRHSRQCGNPVTLGNVLRIRRKGGYPVIPAKAGIQEPRQRQPYGAGRQPRHSRQCRNPAYPGNGNPTARGGNPGILANGESGNPATATIRRGAATPAFLPMRESGISRQRQHTARGRSPPFPPMQESSNPATSAYGARAATVIPAKAGIQEPRQHQPYGRGAATVIPAKAGIQPPGNIKDTARG